MHSRSSFSSSSTWLCRSPPCGVAVAALLALLAVSWATTADASPLRATDLHPPNRPGPDASPEQLRRYLSELSDFYAFAGRQRFGKRMQWSPLYGKSFPMAPMVPMAAPAAAAPGSMAFPMAYPVAGFGEPGALDLQSFYDE